jgi:hypothetical protein
MAEFDYEVIQRKRKENDSSDALSRQYGARAKTDIPIIPLENSAPETQSTQLQKLSTLDDLLLIANHGTEICNDLEDDEFYHYEYAKWEEEQNLEDVAFDAEDEEFPMVETANVELRQESITSTPSMSEWAAAQAKDSALLLTIRYLKS